MAGDLSRRAMVMLAALAPLGANGASAPVARPEPAGSGAKRLVAFFTRSGNTQVIAGTVHRALRTDLFEIRAARPYPEDYEATVAQARRETAAMIAPPLAQRVTDLAGYGTIFLGLPIWGGTAPPVIRSFLAAHDWRGKTIRPFITHGGYGPGDAMSVIRRHAPGARVHDPFVMQADQERRTIDEVRGWLGKTGQG